MSCAKIIVNPQAGAGGSLRKWPTIKNLLKYIGIRFEYSFTEAPGHAIELAKAAAQKCFNPIISVGGDGTINEIVNGLYHSGEMANINMGIISTGTGSDFIHTVGIPRSYSQACRSLQMSSVRKIDLGCIDYTINGAPAKRLFINFAGMGFDSEIVRATTNKYKSLGRKPSYLLGLFSTLISHHNQIAVFTIDGKRQERKLSEILISNGKYGGGGMLTAPDADPSDGFFDVLTIGDLSKPDLIRSLPRIYRGTHITHPKVSVFRASTIEVFSFNGIPVQADGELISAPPAKFSLLPLALNILV